MEHYTQYETEYLTDSLPFACFLLSGKKLQFLRCECNRSSGRVQFVFDDPEKIGTTLYLDFAAGALAPASAFFDSIRHLRKIMDQITEQNMNHGAWHNGRVSR